MMQMGKGRWVRIAAGIAVVVFLALVWIRAPKSVVYETIEIPLPEGFAAFKNLKINDNGVVAGTLRGFHDQSDHVFLWDRDKGLKDLGNPRFVSGQALLEVRDINNNGQLIGRSGFYEPDDETPSMLTLQSVSSFFYDPETGFREIGGLRGFWEPIASAINERGLVVGNCSRLLTNGRTISRVFLWDLESGIRDPNLVGWALSINTSGQVFGWERMTNFLWSPEEGNRTLEPLPLGPILEGFLDDSEEISGFAIGENIEKVPFFSWNRKHGFRSSGSIVWQENGAPPLLAMKERRVLFYQPIKHFDWFGLVKRNNNEIQIRIFTIGEGITIPRSLPKIDSYSASWDINRDGWIVMAKDEKAIVMIPKGKAGRKKD